MSRFRKLTQTIWHYQYHIVWIPKYRRKVLYGKVRKRLGEIVRELCRQKGIEVIDGHALVDHLHVCLSFPPKYSVKKRSFLTNIYSLS